MAVDYKHGILQSTSIVFTGIVLFLGGSDKSSKVLDSASLMGLAEECRMLMQSEDSFLVRCGVDGVAFLSLDADVKEDLVGDSEALAGLFKGH